MAIDWVEQMDWMFTQESASTVLDADVAPLRRTTLSVDADVVVVVPKVDQTWIYPAVSDLDGVRRPVHPPPWVLNGVWRGMEEKTDMNARRFLT